MEHTKAQKITVHIRKQHSRGRSATGFGGPDTYVAITIAPAEVEVPYRLNKKSLKMRGIKLLYFGEGYSNHFGPNSMLGRAIANAKEFRDTETIRLASCKVFGL